MLGTATKSEQDALVERMNAEIARLRGELSRAVAREGVIVELADTYLLVNDPEDEVVQKARRSLETYLENRDPLSDAAQDVLEAAVKLSKERAAPYDSMAQFDEHQDRLDDLLVLLDFRVDRYRALLEGRTRKEG